MVTGRYMRLFMLMTFALLQGMAPLAHAHINGHSEDHHIHLAEVDSHQAYEHELASPSATVEEDHARTVGMQPEFRGKKLELVKLALPAALPAVPEVAPAAEDVRFPAFDIPRITSLPFHHPVSQAPPV